MKKYFYFIRDHVTNFMRNNSKIKTLTDLQIFGGEKYNQKTIEREK